MKKETFSKRKQRQTPNGNAQAIAANESRSAAEHCDRESTTKREVLSIWEDAS